MVNKSQLKKLLVTVILVAGIFSAPVLANPVIGGLLSEGMLVCQPEKFSPEVVRRPANGKKEGNSEFFGTLGPEISAPGSVKTYAIKVVKKLKASDWNRVRETNKAALDTTRKILVRPVIGRVSSLFGRRRHPKKKTMHFHSGIDIVAKKGTPIIAAMAGKVTYSGWKRGYGMVVIVDHGDDLETVYAHCSRVMVKSGQVVNVGQRVASVGSTGVATGSHLHFEVRRGGNVRNPFRYLRN